MCHLFHSAVTARWTRYCVIYCNTNNNNPLLYSYITHHCNCFCLLSEDKGGQSETKTPADHTISVVDECCPHLTGMEVNLSLGSESFMRSEGGKLRCLSTKSNGNRTLRSCCEVVGSCDWLLESCWLEAEKWCPSTLDDEDNVTALCTLNPFALTHNAAPCSVLALLCWCFIYRCFIGQ